MLPRKSPLGSGWEAPTDDRPARLHAWPAAGLPARRAAPAVRADHRPGARRHAGVGHADQVGDPDPGHGRHRARNELWLAVSMVLLFVAVGLILMIYA
jgi:hypothetical protein